jgi:3-methyl-2-oxobutanoate hydroxymethyltransferase
MTELVKYCDVAQVYMEAFRAYIKDVKANVFPEDQHCYHIIKGEEENFAEMLKKFA